MIFSLNPLQAFLAYSIPINVNGEDWNPIENRVYCFNLRPT